MEPKSKTFGKLLGSDLEIIWGVVDVGKVFGILEFPYSTGFGISCFGKTRVGILQIYTRNSEWQPDTLFRLSCNNYRLTIL